MSTELQTFGKWAPTQFDTPGVGSEGKEDWLVVPCLRTRDSRSLEESNYLAAEQWLADIDSKGLDHETKSFTHWGPGWVEILIVRPDSDAHQLALNIAQRLEDYPLLDDDMYSALQSEWHNEKRCYGREDCSECEYEIERHRDKHCPTVGCQRCDEEGYSK